MRWGRRRSAPPAATSERLTSGMPSLASRAATIRSQASATSSPPATAKPSMAAISGLRDARWTMPAKPRSPTHGRSPVTNALRSIPAQKPAPAPVMTPDRELAVGVELVERRRHPFGQRQVDRVARLRAVERDEQHAVAALGEDGLVGHGRTISRPVRAAVMTAFNAPLSIEEVTPAPSPRARPWSGSPPAGCGTCIVTSRA